jgi:hypothetical protein
VSEFVLEADCVIVGLSTTAKGGLIRLELMFVPPNDLSQLSHGWVVDYNDFEKLMSADKFKFRLEKK